MITTRERVLYTIQFVLLGILIVCMLVHSPERPWIPWVAAISGIGIVGAGAWRRTYRNDEDC